MMSSWLAIIVFSPLAIVALGLGGIVLDYINVQLTGLAKWCLRYLLGVLLFQVFAIIFVVAGILNGPTLVAELVFFCIVLFPTVYRYGREFSQDISGYIQRCRQTPLRSGFTLVTIGSATLAQTLVSLAITTDHAVASQYMIIRSNVTLESLQRFSEGMPFWWQVYARTYFLLANDRLTQLVSCSLIISCLAYGYSQLKLRRWWLLSIVTVGIGFLLWQPNWLVQAYPFEKIENGLGIISDQDYVSPLVDCSFEVAQYILHKDVPGSLVDNWSIGYDTRYQYYINRVNFYHLPPDVPTVQVAEALHALAASYIVVNGPAKAYYTNSEDPTVHAYYLERIGEEATILNASDLVYSYEDCSLFKVDFAELDSL